MGPKFVEFLVKYLTRNSPIRILPKPFSLLTFLYYAFNTFCEWLGGAPCYSFDSVWRPFNEA